MVNILNKHFHNLLLTIVILHNLCSAKAQFVADSHEYASGNSIEDISSIICNNDGKVSGGMFGYSVAISSSISSNGQYTEEESYAKEWTYLAVGQPWDSSVVVYAAPKIPQSSNITIPNNSTGEKFDSSGFFQKKANWKKLQILRDTGNGTWPSRAYSLFGYSVSMSSDGEWLAIGIPGKMFTASDRVVLLQFHNYTGSVRIFRLDRSISPIPKYKLVSEIRHPGRNQFWTKFGSKVLIKETNQKEYHLFVGANSGWDGASTQFYAAQPNNEQWPINPRNVESSGIYVFLLSDNLDNDMSNDIYIPQKSPGPLGSLGQDFDVIFGQNGKYHVFMRDFIIPSKYESLYAASCPSLDCSFLSITSNDGLPVIVNATGVVVHYVIDLKQSSFELKQIFQKNDFVNLQSVKNNEKLFQYIYSTEWISNDWFGVGISVALDDFNSNYILAVGAPKNSKAVFFYRSKSSNIYDNWKAVTIIENESRSTNSFFGQKMKFSPDGRLLLIADPVDSNIRPGGSVKVYHRRSEYDILPAFPNIVRLPTADEIYFDPIYLADRNGTFGDQFGFGLIVNDAYFVVSSHISECVYIISQPLIVALSKPVPPPPIDQTISSRSLGYGNNLEAEASRQKQTIIIGSISGGVGLLCGLVVFMGLYKYHRKRVLTQLEMQNLKKVMTEDSTENIVDTRVGSIENVVNESTSTLHHVENKEKDDKLKKGKGKSSAVNTQDDSVSISQFSQISKTSEKAKTKRWNY